MTFPAALKQLAAKIDAHTRRERIILLLTLIVGLYGAWDFLLMQPLQQTQKRTQAAITQSQEQITTLADTIGEIARTRTIDPNRANRERLTQLKAQLAQLDAQLGALTSDLIPPATMTTVLRDLLAEQGSLELVRIENLGAVPLITPPEQSKQDSVEESLPLVYKHSMVIEFRGSYADTLRYLSAIEKLHWRFYWDSLDYQVQDHPMALVTLTIATLSLKEGWIGA